MGCMQSGICCGSGNTFNQYVTPDAFGNRRQNEMNLTRDGHERNEERKGVDQGDKEEYKDGGDQRQIADNQDQHHDGQRANLFEDVKGDGEGVYYGDDDGENNGKGDGENDDVEELDFNLQEERRLKIAEEEVKLKVERRVKIAEDEEVKLQSANDLYDLFYPNQNVNGNNSNPNHLNNNQQVQNIIQNHPVNPQDL
ncbi:hypothetical protein OXYTRIMIC_431 [Oxytricha trifallax]|uniref:Uncharacterized protein n=1 Tax=Oxytricha trifallax TaxID=1172189 RepID=A0A073HZY8_9SPIT|nr:hypothetical protein OXYTRIMIC_431 [Oxytricha trifallax]